MTISKLKKNPPKSKQSKPAKASKKTTEKEQEVKIERTIAKERDIAVPPSAQEILTKIALMLSITGVSCTPVQGKIIREDRFGNKYQSPVELNCGGVPVHLYGNIVVVGTRRCLVYNEKEVMRAILTSIQERKKARKEAKESQQTAQHTAPKINYKNLEITKLVKFCVIG